MRHSTHGIQLQMSDMGATPVFTTIAQVTSVTPLSGSRGFTPAAEHDMTGAIEKVFDALRDEGQVVFTINVDPAEATHDEVTGIEAAYQDGTERDFRLIFPDAGTKQADFAAAVVNRVYGEYAANTGIGNATVTLEISGAVAWT